MLQLVFGRTNSRSTASLWHCEVWCSLNFRTAFFQFEKTLDVNVCAVFLKVAKLPLILV